MPNKITIVASKQPLVVVSVGVFNHGAYLLECLNSIENQTYDNIQIVIIDNCSTDNSKQIINQFESRRKVEKIFNAENTGANGMFNQCLEQLAGDYLKIVCGDDLIDSTQIEKQVFALEKNSEASFAFNAKRIINSTGKVLLTRKANLKPGLQETNHIIKTFFTYGTHILGESNAHLLRSKPLRQSGIGFDYKYEFAIDVSFEYKLLRLGPCYYVDEVLSSFRVSKTSLSAKVLYRHFSDYSMFLEDLKGQYAHISAFDLLVGKSMAFINQILRVIFYLFLS